MSSFKNHPHLKPSTKITKEDFKLVKKVFFCGHHQTWNSKNLTSIKTTLTMKNIAYFLQSEVL